MKEETVLAVDRESR